MAIADKLTKLTTDITNAYTAIDNKGGTIPANKNTDNLASAIGSISTGTTPIGTKQVSITQNGTITEDVTDYASAEISVNVPMPSGDAWEKHTVDFTLASSTGYNTIMDMYVKECANHIIYPTDPNNTATNTIVISESYNVSSKIGTITTGTGVTTSTSIGQFKVNDQTYNAIRTRGNINNKPAGDYRLIFYGVAK